MKILFSNVYRDYKFEGSLSKILYLVRKNVQVDYPIILKDNIDDDLRMYLDNAGYDIVDPSRDDVGRG